jgi:hypothetical protein
MTREWSTLASAFEQRVLRWAFRQLGSSYVWGGKGDVRFDPVKGLRPWAVGELLNPGRRAYDCSGLVACALREVSGFDIRAKWNTGLMLESTKPYASRDFFHAQLRFYGPSVVNHVAFAFPSRGAWDDSVMLLEAAGAGSDAINETVAMRLGASVRYTTEGVRAGDLVAWVPLWSLGVAAGAVPKP